MLVFEIKVNRLHFIVLNCTQCSSKCRYQFRRFVHVT